jgi:hypothetical protein
MKLTGQDRLDKLNDLGQFTVNERKETDVNALESEVNQI